MSSKRKQDLTDALKELKEARSGAKNRCRQMNFEEPKNDASDDNSDDDDNSDNDDYDEYDANKDDYKRDTADERKQTKAQQEAKQKRLANLSAGKQKMNAVEWCLLRGCEFFCFVCVLCVFFLFHCKHTQPQQTYVKHTTNTYIHTQQIYTNKHTHTKSTFTTIK
eukprot:c23045_g1_i1.p1 GENE.c23045_g1_i1~~c23045_g1_i1.p1  ORF type:complete len:194 (-),score=62.53 c23045_g1_i1:19-513(-)